MLFLSMGSPDAVFRTLRFIFYLTFLALFTKEFFSLELTLSIYKKIVFFATVYLLIQYILFRGFGYYLPGYIPFLPIQRTELIDYSTQVYTHINQRMRSIFQEPSQYADYTCTCMMIIALHNIYKKTPKNILLCIFFSLGIFFSESTSGIVLMSFPWLIIFFSNKSKISLGYFILFPILFLFLFLSREELPLEENQVERTDRNATVGEIEDRIEEGERLAPDPG